MIPETLEDLLEQLLVLQMQELEPKGLHVFHVPCSMFGLINSLLEGDVRPVYLDKVNCAYQYLADSKKLDLIIRLVRMIKDATLPVTHSG